MKRGTNYGGLMMLALLAGGGLWWATRTQGNLRTW